MSITFMQQVVRISDRFKKDPDSIDRAGQLHQVLILVVIFHIILGIYFVKMDEYERKHPRVIHETNLDFELTAPPPAPDFKVGEVPKPITLTEGENPDSGSSAAAKPLEADKVTIPTPKAPETLPVPTPEAAKPVPSHKTTVAPPVSVVTNNMIKALPTSAPRTAPKAPPSANVGASSNTIASGAPREGGGPDGQEGGTGNGGTGSGGEGSGEGDPGTGTGFGNIGGDIATKIGGGTGRAMGNIAPYRKDMLMRIAQNWHPKKKNETMQLQISIGKDGQVLSAEIIESSGNKRSDKEALAAIEQTEFAPLPDWYKGEQLTFKIDFAKVEALQ